MNLFPFVTDKLFRPIRFYFIEIDTTKPKRITGFDKPTTVKIPTDNPNIWVTVKKCKNRVEAIDYVMEKYGADKYGNINILS